MADYHLLDVFTTEPFAGNPLAVFVDQPVTDTALMQHIARELNLSETVFVARRDDSGAFPTRIFTPTNELPFAGHPTIGTAVLVASLGLADGDELVLAEGVGDVRVSVKGATAEFLTAVLPKRVEVIDRERAAAAVGLTAADLHPDFEPAVWDCGLPWAMVAVADVATLGRTHGVAGYYDSVYAVAPDGDGSRWRARAFVPAFGIVEDPATGSAVAGFAGFVAHLPFDRFVVMQGVEMGRPSELRLSVERSDERLSAVRVAGEAVVVGGGTLRV
ncbi:MAG: trans-2,3-dihydro-3-hydroxyanthranilate isomerase [Actinomycetota bacterium]|jgi:trans-2,3-dihydro-3-hydroxyanthranilate isomerase